MQTYKTTSKTMTPKKVGTLRFSSKSRSETTESSVSGESSMLWCAMCGRRAGTCPCLIPLTSSRPARQIRSQVRRSVSLTKDKEVLERKSRIGPIRDTSLRSNESKKGRATPDTAAIAEQLSTFPVIDRFDPQNCEHLGHLLQEDNLTCYLNTFLRHHVNTIQIFLELTEAHLIEMDIPVGGRIKLNLLVQTVKNGQNPRLCASCQAGLELMQSQDTPVHNEVPRILESCNRAFTSE